MSHLLALHDRVCSILRNGQFLIHVQHGALDATSWRQKVCQTALYMLCRHDDSLVIVDDFHALFIIWKYSVKWGPGQNWELGEHHSIGVATLVKKITFLRLKKSSVVKMEASLRYFGGGVTRGLPCILIEAALNPSGIHMTPISVACNSSLAKFLLHDNM